MIHLDFAWSELKDRSCLDPLYRQVKGMGWDASFVKIHKHGFRNRRAARNLASHVVAAFDKPIGKLKAAGYQGRFIYVDHGVGPVKYYAYRYRNLHECDLLFYQGDVFRRKMLAVNPGFGNGLMGGFTKIDNLVNNSIDREALCASNNLDPSAPVVLFAPTWGGKYGDHWGIRNARHLEGFPNLVVAPHPADYRFARRFGAVLPDRNSNINRYIKLADVVVSDVSSIVGEAAAIGKPTVQLSLPSYPGCFPEEDRRNERSWISEKIIDFEMRNTDRSDRPFKIPYLDEDWIVDRVAEPADLWHTVEDALNDPERNAKTRAYWGDQCCWKADGATCARIAGMIESFILTGELVQATT